MITCKFGLPGCGKTTVSVRDARKELRRIRCGKSKYKRVLSNYYIEGCQQVRFEDLGVIDLSDSLILLDELTLDADSRDFKRFRPETKEFFILHRHYGCDVIYYTQDYSGVDKKIRDLTAKLWFLRKVGPWTVEKRIDRAIIIPEETGEIVQGYKFPERIEQLFGMIFPFLGVKKLCFRPFWYKYFDSWENKRVLPVKKFENW